MYLEAKVLSFSVLKDNPIQSANELCWLDCESAALDGGRIIVSAVKQSGYDIDDLPFKPLDGHPLVRWCLMNKENARWLYRYTRASSIKWKNMSNQSSYDSEYEQMAKDLSVVAGLIDTKIKELFPSGQQTLFGLYQANEGDITWIEDGDATWSYYDRTRRHLTWGDEDPTLYGGTKNEQ